MNRKTTAAFIAFMCLAGTLSSCSRTKPAVKEDSVTESIQISPPALISEESKGEKKFSSMEEAYYSKYAELAETYGTYSLYDSYPVKRDYSGHSYLSGVCVVNLMDFNRDGVQDLFILYSNGRMNKIVNDGSNVDLEIYELPDQDTYEIEIWTYTEGGLAQILKESSVSICYSYPNDKSDFFRKYYQNFITVYENRDGIPVIQIYDESGEGRKYTNIYYAEGQVVKDQLLYHDDTIQINGVEVTEDVWSEHVAGFNKILLCTLLADSHQSSRDLFEGYHIDYNNTLLQTQRVVRYLAGEDTTPSMAKFSVKEGNDVALYLQELERANRIRLGPEFAENHYFQLYDIDQDGIPELILYEGSSGAGAHYHFYTIMDGALINCGSYGRTALYTDGAGGLITYYGRMNGYEINKIVLENAAISITEIASGYAQDSYPELETFGYEHYEELTFCPPAIPFALYTYK